MGNCLVTKLKGTVDNNNLLKLGEIAIRFDVAETVSDDFLAIRVDTQEAGVARVINGTFMNADRSAAEGTTKNLAAQSSNILRVSNTGATLIIPNKYTSMILPNAQSWFHKGIHFDLNEVFVGKTFSGTGIPYRGMEDMTGDFKALKGNFTYIDLMNCFSFGGDINEGDFVVSADVNINSSKVTGVFANSFIDKSKATITGINIQGSKIADDIANIPVMPSLLTFRLTYADLFGNIANFPHLENMIYLEIHGNTNIEGDIAALYIPNTVETVNVQNTSITGALEDFAQACVTRGRTSGIIKVNIGGTTITVNGSHSEQWYWQIVFNGSGYELVSGW